MSLRALVMAVIGVLLVLIAYRLFVPLEHTVSKTMPVHLQGTWITTDLHYSDHYVEIGPDFIVFGTGGVTGRRFPVTGFDQRYRDDGELVNTVHFKGADGSRSSRQFIFTPENRGQLVFANQQGVVWVRQRDAKAEQD